jgi:hypothetical protein
MRLVSKISSVTLEEQIGQTWRPVIAAVVMAIFVAYGIMSLSASPWHIFILLGAGVVGATLYLTVIFLLWLAVGRPTGAETNALAMLRTTLANRSAQRST